MVVVYKGDAVTKSVEDVSGKMIDQLDFDSGLNGRNWSSVTGFIDRKRLMTTIALFLATAVDVGCLSSNGSFFPAAALSKGMNVTLIGVITSSVAVACIIFGGILGRLLPIIGTRFMTLAGLFIVAGATLAQAFLLMTKSGLPFLLTSTMCNFVKGIGYVSRSMGVMAMIGADFESKIAMYLGFHELASGVGSALGPILGGYLNDKYGFEMGFYVPAAMEFFAFCFVYVALQPSTVFRSGGHTDFTDDGSSEVNEVKTMLKYPPFYFPLLSVVVSIFITVSFGTTISIYTTHQFGDTSVGSGVMLFVYHGTIAIVSPIVGYLADKKGFHELILTSGHILTIVASLLLGPSTIFGIEPAEWLTTVASAVLAIGASFLFLPSMELNLKLARRLQLHDAVKIKSLISTAVLYAMNFGSLSGPLIGGLLVDKVGFRDTGLYIALFSLVVGVINLVCFIFLRFNKPPRYDHMIDHEEARNLID